MSVSPAEFGKIFSGRRVFVTGHTGFKGSWLAFWLARLGAEVTGYSLAPPSEPNLFGALDLESRLRHVTGDVRDIDVFRAAWREARPELAFHLAAQPLVRESYIDPLKTIGTNIMGTVNMLEIARTESQPVSMLLVTSDKCYENRETTQGYKETDRMGGHDVYSMSKGAAELAISSYRRSFFSHSDDLEISVASARAGNVIGGGDWAVDRIVPDCIRALQSGKPVSVRRPDAVRPWQHVLEPLSGYLTLGALLLSSESETRQKASDAWNFGPEGDEANSVRELVEMTIERWGSGIWVDESTGGGVHEAAVLRLSIEKASRELGWHPRWDFPKTVARTVDWYHAFYAGDDMRAWCARQIDEHSGSVGRIAMAQHSMTDLPIAGVEVHPLTRFPDERGALMHMLRSDDPHFQAFGEIYFSRIVPGGIKAWHIHREMTLNYAVPFGMIDLVLYDDRERSATRGHLMHVRTGDSNYALVTIPPGIWYGFKGLGESPAIVANCATMPYDASEISRKDPSDPSIPYDWSATSG